MTKRFELSIYNMMGERLCTLFDSKYDQDGAARDIEITKEQNGWKEISMTVPYLLRNGEPNFRRDYVLDENLLYLYEDGVCDVYTIKTNSDTHSEKRLDIKLQANHISEELKAKNLYKYFDDENGIGKCDVLIERALAGTGWGLEYCDTFYEADGTTEKVRSYQCEAKTGAYNMISGICDLFKAHPVFHYDGEDKTVSIYANQDTEGYLELNFGKNMGKITRKKDSSNVVTRLYVEGEYGDFGYVGINSVNPTGLPFILNFDYYKELGLFTATHEAAMATYLSTYANLTEAIQEAMEDLLEAQASLIALIGTCGYILCPIVSGTIDLTQMIAGGDYEESDKSYETGDPIVLIKADGSYVHDTYPPASLSGYSYIIKFLPTITGLMAAHEDLITVSEEAVPSTLENLNKFLDKNGYTEVEDVDDLYTIYDVDDLSEVDDDDYDPSGLALPWSRDTTRSYVGSIGDAINLGANTQEELNDETLEMIDLMQDIAGLEEDIATDQAAQVTAEDTFVAAVGTMLRDGYWSDDNYTVGQEESLYQDALGISNRLAFPIVTYDIDYRAISAVEGYEDEETLLRQLVRIYDEDLNIDDFVYPETIKQYPDNRKKDNVELTTDILNIGDKTFNTMIDRITEMANEVKNNRDIYKRAAAISKEGKFSSALLEGAIDTLTHRLQSTSSNWTTDDKGNLIFTSLDGESAMMLCGYGFMVASSKNADGSWKWRTFGTGEGFTADMIITGFLNAERIQAGSITTNHLSSEVGEELDISSNQAIALIVDQSEMKVTPDSIISTVSLVDDDTGLVVSSSVRSQFVDAIDDVIVDGANFSQVSQTADEIKWLISDGSTSSSITLMPDAISAISDQITISARNLAFIADEIDLSANESVHIVIAEAMEDMNTWFSFTQDGFYVGKDGSTYRTLTDDTGFHILQEEDMIGSFAKRQLAVEEVRIGVVTTIGQSTRCVIREAADGGLIITTEEMT